MLSLYSFPNQLVRGNIGQSVVESCTVSVPSPSDMWIFLLIPCIQSTFRRVLRCLLLTQELKHPCSSGEVLPSYWQCAQVFTLPKGKALFYSLRALFTWQTIHFGGVSLISWIYFDPMYICCHALWRNKIVYLEQMHICFCVWLLWLGWIQACTRLRNVRCSLSAQHLLGSDACFTQEPILLSQRL